MPQFGMEVFMVPTGEVIKKALITLNTTSIQSLYNVLSVYSVFLPNRPINFARIKSIIPSYSV